MNWATGIVLLVVATFVILAIRILRTGKGSCSCGENTKRTNNYSKCSSCSAECPFKMTV